MVDNRRVLGAATIIWQIPGSTAFRNRFLTNESEPNVPLWKVFFSCDWMIIFCLFYFCEGTRWVARGKKRNLLAMKMRVLISVRNILVITLPSCHNLILRLSFYEGRKIDFCGFLQFGFSCHSWRKKRCKIERFQVSNSISLKSCSWRKDCYLLFCFVSGKEEESRRVVVQCLHKNG